jgi:hypothetical protein
MVTRAVTELDGQKLWWPHRQRVWLIGDLARESGVHGNFIAELEDGKGGAYPETIRRLVKAPDVGPTELVGE